MPKDNLIRMIQLAEEIFDVKNDPEQIEVNEHVLERLHKIHPACVAQKSTRNGPVAWSLVFPTSERLMKLFLKKEITERELLSRTRAGFNYNAVYLCSILVLPEYRQKGIAQKLLLKSIKSICREHSVEYLFCWPISNKGDKLAELIAAKLKMPLFKR